MSIQSKNVFRYSLILLPIFILFKKKIDQMLLALLVKPIMSYVYPSSWVFDIIIILICIITGFYFIKKMNKGVSISAYWIFITLIYAIAYSFYRYTNSPFSFTSFSFSNKVKLLDVVTLFALAICLLSPLFKKRNEIIQTELGFDVDEPIKIDKENDLLNRLKFVKNIAAIIQNTKSEHGSFPIGVVSPWGSGKTTFLYSLKNEIERDCIVIELDVWRCNSSNQIIDTFFKLLQQKLKPFSFSINSKIKEYSNNLIKGFKSEFIKNISEVFLSNENIEELYENVNEEIKKINKRIVVLIDDTDRLNKQEIYEVIRLIRNTANFSNVFFVVAYDRNYILNAIEEINSYQSHVFLEKIFQVEFSLPPIETNLFVNEIINKISKIISPESKKSFDEFLKKDFAFSFNKTDLTFFYISNMRDVVRFVNSFRIHYQFVKDEIYFPDFYNLQLIRFKHPEIFIEFFRKRNKFLASGTRKNYYPEKPQTYALSTEELIPGNAKKKEFALKLYLQNQKSIYKIDENEIDVITKSFSRIFQEHDNIELKAENSFLSVVKPSMFDRYFRLGIEGRLSEIEFSKARALNINEFLEKINGWSGDKAILSEVGDRFEEIEDFDSKEDFEKVIKAIFHLGEIEYYDKSNLESKLNNYENKLITRYYKDDDKRLQNFIIGLFKEAKSPFLFASDFIRYLNSRYMDPNFFILSKEELNSLSITYLRTYCSTNDELDRNTWALFWNCEQVNFISPGGTSYRNDKLIPEKAKDIMKDFVINKDLNGFLRSIRDFEPFHYKKFKISDTVIKLFNDWESFEKVLKEQDENKWSYLKEFKDFFELVKAKNFMEYVDFKFETIPGGENKL